ncbi:MAG: chalcone isomerase family protein [Gammaproteobacteria bacterium]|nr:chalcone isomerase family protein [Gammaproteobacteria bacterium]
MRRTLLPLIAGLLLIAPAFGATVDGVTVADSARVGGATLQLNGAGRRTKYFFNVYVAALYLRARTATAAVALADPGPIRLSMTLMRHLSASQLVDALREGIARNADAAALARTRADLEALVATMRAIGGADRGDLITLDFLADGSTVVGLDGRPRGRPIPGREFQRQLLSIWLGADPVQGDLRRELLGG